MATPVRGDHEIDQAVKTKWDASSPALDDAFRAYSTDATMTHYPVLHDQMAAPSPPHPYCIFQSLPLPLEGRSAGPASTEFSEYRRREIRFTIYARATAANEDPKEVVIALAEKVKAEFDPNGGALSLENDCEVQRLPLPDVLVREDDEGQQYSFSVGYTVLYEAVYEAP